MALAELHQNVGQCEPISLLTMYTPRGISVSDSDFMLRGRAMELGEIFTKETGAIEAITQIMEVLRDEGINNVDFDPDDLRHIGDDLSHSMPQGRAVQEELILYQALIWKTAGNGMWTMKRDPSECKMIPYIPLLLKLSKMPMSATISAGNDHLMPGECGISEELKAVLKDQQTADNWQEISFLEFINLTLPSSKVHQAIGPTSQAIIQVITTKDRKLTWRASRDSDNEAGEVIFESDGNRLYVRTDSDVRKLYEGRPARMREMRMVQLACEYRLLMPSDNCFETAKNSINEETNVGPNSSDLVAGTRNTFAPKAMRLANDKIMKKRTDDKVVPHLLFSGMMSRHGSQLMWDPWQKLEDVTGQQDEIETAEQRQTRLHIFPLSKFPYIDEDSGESDN